MITRSKGFTLVELLIVAGLIAILGVAIFRSFNNGLKLWSKLQRMSKQTDVTIFLIKFGEDLRSATTMSNLVFKGSEFKVVFPAIILAKADPRSSRSMEEIADQIGLVQYRFDLAERIIYRKQARYGQALKGKWDDETIALSGIDSFNFAYDVRSDSGSSLKSNVQGVIPSNVKVNINFTDDSGEREVKRFYSIPIGG